MARETKPGGSINAQQAGLLVGVSPRRIQQLSKQSWIPRADRGRYLVRDVVHGYIKFLDDRRDRGEASGSATALLDAKAQRIEKQNARTAERLMHFDEFAEAANELLEVLTAEFAKAPTRITRDPTIRRKLSDAFDAVLTRARKRLDESTRKLRETVRAS